MLDSHEELDNHSRVQARSRGERWCQLDPQVSPGEMKSREVELGSESWTTFCIISCSPTLSCSTDTVFVTLLCTAVERAVSEVHKLLGAGGIPTSSVVVVAVADGLFRLCGFRWKCLWNVYRP